MNRTLSSLWNRADENREISHRPLTYLTFAGVCCRVFALLVVDLPETLHAAWIASLLGAILAFPAVLFVYWLSGKGNPAAVLRSAFGKRFYQAFCLLFSAFLAADASSVFSMLSASASYSSLFSIPEWALSLLSFLAVALIVLRGGNSVSGVASVCLYAFPFLYVWMLILQRNHLNFRYLVPILGPGSQKLMRCGLLCAGEYCLIPLSALLDDRKLITGKGRFTPVPPRSIFELFALSAIVVTALCALHAATYPALPSLSRSRFAQLDLLLSIGKSNQSIQLPMLLLWFAFLTVCASFLLYLSGRLLSAAFGIRFGGTAIAAAAGTFLFGFFLNNNLSLRLTSVFPFLFTAFIFVGWALSRFKNRDARKARPKKGSGV